jgi:hypothetical protein
MSVQWCHLTEILAKIVTVMQIASAVMDQKAIASANSGGPQALLDFAKW